MRRRGAWPADETAVTEVLGYVLTFAILSGVMLLALLGFIHVREQGEAPRAQAGAQAIADAVAAAAVEAAALADQGATDVVVRVEAPDQVYGRGYAVWLDAAGVVWVEVQGLHALALPPPATAAAPLMGAHEAGAGAPVPWSVCEVPVTTGPIEVRIGDPADAPAADKYSVLCTTPPHLFLTEASP